MPSNCPNCNSRQDGRQRNGGWYFCCGTFRTVVGQMLTTERCRGLAKDRTIAALTAEVERLKKLEAAVRDDEVIIQLVKNCSSRSHDDRYCDWCEGREAGMDEYQSHLLGILDPKEEPPCLT